MYAAGAASDSLASQVCEQTVSTQGSERESTQMECTPLMDSRSLQGLGPAIWLLSADLADGHIVHAQC